MTDVERAMDWMLWIAGLSVGGACLTVVAARLMRRPQSRAARRRAFPRPA
jgi:hypothetical protein